MTRNDSDTSAFDRATLLRQAVVGATGLLLSGAAAGCGHASTTPDRQEATTHGGAVRRNVLVAYFSRAGENYYH
jgi:hypothetical protein